MVLIRKIRHSGFVIEDDAVRIVIDPFKARDDEAVPVTLALVTHPHFDHLELESLAKFVTHETIIVGTADAHSTLAKLSAREVRLVKPGDVVDIANVRVEAVPAYNVNKPYHPKENGWVGYLITLPSGVRVYHAGDTDAIPELEGLEANVILLPVSGTYVMTADEAARLAQRLRARVFIPMHYGVIVGSDADAAVFAREVGSAARVLGEGEAIEFS